MNTVHYSAVHERALLALSLEWISYTDLKDIAPFSAFDDLAQWGHIDSKIVQLYKYGYPNGSQHYYKMKTHHDGLHDLDFIQAAV